MVEQAGQTQRRGIDPWSELGRLDEDQPWAFGVGHWVRTNGGGVLWEPQGD